MPKHSIEHDDNLKHNFYSDHYISAEMPVGSSEKGNPRPLCQKAGADGFQESGKYY